MQVESEQTPAMWQRKKKDWEKGRSQSEQVTIEETSILIPEDKLSRLNIFYVRSPKAASS
jgi:hypothetical protein